MVASALPLLQLLFERSQAHLIQIMELEPQIFRSLAWLNLLETQDELEELHLKVPGLLAQPVEVLPFRNESKAWFSPPPTSFQVLDAEVELEQSPVQDLQLLTGEHARKVNEQLLGLLLVFLELSVYLLEALTLEQSL